MSKSKATAVKSPADQPPPTKPAGPTWAQTLRETVESVAIAFILAFLFRTFEAEAFVIPTGSMAPTLQGRHKDVVCPQCGYEYRVSASPEVDENGDPRRNCHVVETTCPMCRYELNVDPSDPRNSIDYPSYNGDRIIVNKFAYDLSDPQRWDVVVFKFPKDSKINYIKRLVGLPNERLRIINGDVYTAPPGTEDFQIARKPPEKLRAMLQPVFDNDFVVPKLIEAGMAPRWQPWSANPAGNDWKTSSDFKSFTAESSAPERTWLRYQHILPTTEIWDAIENHRKVISPAPSLIKDFYAYDDGEFAGCGEQSHGDRNWVGDLAMDLQLEVKNNRGAVVLELVKGGRRFDCRIDLATGEAKLSISGMADFAPVATTPIRGPGTYDVSFSNVDRQLLLRVNGKVIDFNSPTTFGDLHNAEPVLVQPVPGSEQATDLSPAGIAVEGGASVAVSRVKLWRDIFYSVDQDDPYLGKFVVQQDVSRIEDLKANEFFMMGDNSPASADSRYWGHVDRRLLIGKALFIYWPHSWWPSWAQTINMKGVELKIPFWPNFKRMTFVH